MGKIAFLLGLLCLAPSCFSATVTAIQSDASLVLSNRKIIRLSDIYIPYSPDRTVQGKWHYGEPLGTEAHEALLTLTQHKNITLLQAQSPDRHGDIPAQVYVENVWLQLALVQQGWAEVLVTMHADATALKPLLAAEHEARAARRGVWANTFYQPVSPREAERQLDRYLLVEGSVTGIGHSHGNIYLNFTQDWRGHFAAFIARKHVPAFNENWLNGLVGKTVLVRGWIHYIHAPLMDITRPEQIDVE